ncbi:MAG: hypothetical protein CMO01_07615 [Thalassobius sp.]|nr:hypothetical protein [Thalassovita sp.]
MKNILLIILFFSFYGANAQKFSKDLWHKGEIDLTTGETVSGFIKYDLQSDNLIYKNGNTVRSYNATRVEAWQIVDQKSKQVRYFFTLPYSTDGTSYKKPTFFELLTEGEPYSLLGREKIVEKVENMYDPYWFGGRNVRVTVQVDDYFLINDDGKIAYCSRELEEALAMLNDKDKVLKKFIKVNKLDIERREDMVQVVDYYNSLNQQ